MRNDYFTIMRYIQLLELDNIIKCDYKNIYEKYNNDIIIYIAEYNDMCIQQIKICSEDFIISKKQIKNQYYKKAKIYHPDKRRNVDSVIPDICNINKVRLSCINIQFYELNEAYNYLKENICFINKFLMFYISILKFMNIIDNYFLWFKRNNIKFINFIKIIKQYLKNIGTYSPSNTLSYPLRPPFCLKGDVVFSKGHPPILILPPTSSRFSVGESKLLLYQLFHYFIRILFCYIYHKKKKIIVYQHIHENKTNKFIIHPTLNDLLRCNIYKFEINNYILLIPLWQKEIYYELPNLQSIYFKIAPVKDKNIIIDNYNNIIVHKFFLFHQIQELLNNNEDICILLGDYKFTIPIENLYIMKKQTYILHNKGLPKNIDNDIFNISEKSDIIVNIILQ